jgi:hypothetical protein
MTIDVEITDDKARSGAEQMRQDAEQVVDERRLRRALACQILFRGMHIVIMDEWLLMILMSNHS